MDRFIGTTGPDKCRYTARWCRKYRHPLLEGDVAYVGEICISGCQGPRLRGCFRSASRSPSHPPSSSPPRACHSCPPPGGGAQSARERGIEGGEALSGRTRSWARRRSGSSSSRGAGRDRPAGARCRRSCGGCRRGRRSCRRSGRRRGSRPRSRLAARRA